ncbi:glycosyltransferase family 2 protein [Thalassococcus sp. S3]|uniref:glycosyltransferase family 2 protein n=1 Tax=Thalassococcus sp. S3 TaxID=2017482 RepID=UPI0010246626|nr:glycosyltransferase family 2 protein [Thalassococcus sp. S3]QBF31401.1 glycosyl transferase family 2 [Thalassococcus sp. S3]
MRTLAVLTLRNEGAFLLDWLAHHITCGFDDFLVFSNDCADGTDLMLDRLAAMGHLTHIRNDGPYHERGIQFTALKTADRTDAVAQADWLLTVDIDEFVNIHVGAGTLADLYAALPRATAITLTWRLFGNAGVVDYVDAPITGQFTRCAPRTLTWPWRASFFKTLYRNDGTYAKLGVHRPRQPDRSRLPLSHWYDGSGRPLAEPFKTKRIFSDFGRSNHDLVQLNHYPLGAMQSYVLKASRGRAVHAQDRLGLDYWVERNFNTCEDKTILRFAARAEKVRAELGRDAELQRLHKAAVAWRLTEFETLMQDEPNRSLFGRLLMTPSSRPLDPTEAKRIFAYGRAARASASD